LISECGTVLTETHEGFGSVDRELIGITLELAGELRQVESIGTSIPGLL